MHNLATFYKDKKVFLTGGTGFKGSWLCLLLNELGAKVFDYSLKPPSSPALWDLATINELVTHFHGDITHKDKLTSCMTEIKPDIVLHLAAQSLVRPSYLDPYDTFSVNILGTASLLEAVRACPSVKSCIIVTSDKCYENIGKHHPYEESDRMGGHDPYSASKGCAELVTAAYRHSFFKNDEQGIATVRAGNVIGGGDFATDRLIPDMVRAFTAGEKVRIRYPNATRPWQHVLDPLNGYLILAQKLYQSYSDFSGGWNFGPLDNEAHTVAEVLAEFSLAWGTGVQYESENEEQPHEAAFLGLNAQKAYQSLNWQPQLSFKDSVEWTASWYNAWHKHDNARKLCLEQIHKYLEL